MRIDARRRKWKKEYCDMITEGIIDGTISKWEDLEPIYDKVKYVFSTDPEKFFRASEFFFEYLYYIRKNPSEQYQKRIIEVINRIRTEAVIIFQFDKLDDAKKRLFQEVYDSLMQGNSQQKSPALETIYNEMVIQEKRIKTSHIMTIWSIVLSAAASILSIFALLKPISNKDISKISNTVSSATTISQCQCDTLFLKNIK